MSDTIQSLLDKTPLGGTLKLEPPKSEIQGPLVLRHPINIVGQGCSVWAEQGPVLTAESSGVVLTDLNIEVTGSQPDQGGAEGAALVVAPKVGITMNNVIVRGNVLGLAGEEGQWRYPRSVRLGSIKADQKHTFMVRLVVPVPCQLTSEIAGLEVTPAKLTPGPIEANVSIDPLKAGTRLRGFLKLRTPLVTRQIQLTCHVQADAKAAIGTGQVVEQPADWGTPASATPQAPTVPEPASLPVSPPGAPIVIDPGLAAPDLSLDGPGVPVPCELAQEEAETPVSPPASTPASPRSTGARRGRHRRPDNATLPGVFQQAPTVNTQAAEQTQPAEAIAAHEETPVSPPLSPSISGRPRRPPVGSLFMPAAAATPEPTEPAEPVTPAEEVPATAEQPPAETPPPRRRPGRKLGGIFGDPSEPRT